MSDLGSKSVDLLGIKPVGEALLKVTSAVVDGAVGFLHRVCSPAAEELGLLLADKIRARRAANTRAILEAAEQKLKGAAEGDGGRADPRIVFNILEAGAWIADSFVQDMWAGLLASSCTPEGDDDSNLPFTNLLGQMTKLQARILDYACRKARLRLDEGIVFAGYHFCGCDVLGQAVGECDVHRLGRELEQLSAWGLLQEQHMVANALSVATLTPTPLALNMYVRCQGSRKSPPEFFGLVSSADQ